MATYQRAHLLARSLVCYANQDFPKDEFELVIIDDHSNDGTGNLVKSLCGEHGIRYTLLTTGPKSQQWRDCGAVLNAGIRASQGEHILLTHPEVMVGRRTVAASVEKLAEFEAFRNGGFYLGDWPKWGQPIPDPVTERIVPPWRGCYCAAKPYYLSQRDQERIDTVDWVGEGPLAVRKIEGFYDEQPGHPDYKPRAIESVGKPGAQHPHWLSWVFGGFSRRTLKYMGGIGPVTQKWGSIDVLLVARRRALGIVNHTCIDDDTLVVHQNHSGPNDVPTPRIEQVWKDELAGIDMRPEMLRWPNVDELGWGG